MAPSSSMHSGHYLLSKPCSCSWQANIDPLSERLILSYLPNWDLLPNVASVSRHLCVAVHESITSVWLQFMTSEPDERLESLQQRFPNLRRLDIAGGASISDLSGLESLKLKSLGLWNCNKVWKFSPLSSLSTLRVLEISNQDHLQTLDALAFLSRLESIRIWHCDSLRHISALLHLPSLSSLDIAYCNSIEDCFSTIAGISSLDCLSISQCGGILNEASGCPIPVWSEMKKLELSYGYISFFLSAMTMVTSFKMRHCLISLDLSGNVTVHTNLVAISSLLSLQSLKLRSWRYLSDVSCLSSLPSLLSLDLTNCPNLREISPLGDLGNLTYLNLHGSNVTILSSLKSLKNLSVLIVSYCSHLHYTAELQYLESLGYIELTGCGAQIQRDVHNLLCQSKPECICNRSRRLSNP